MPPASNLQDLKQKMLRSVCRQINERLNRKRQQIIDDVGQVLRDAFISSEIWADLQTSMLRGELGLVQPISALSQILDEIIRSIEIVECKVFPTTKGIGGGLTLVAVPSDYQNLMTLPFASFISEKGYKIEWLAWLLTEGTRAVVTNYHFIPKEKGRTGLGVMVPRGEYKISEAYAGKFGDNFITKIIDGCRTKAIQAILRAISSK